MASKLLVTSLQRQKFYMIKSQTQSQTNGVYLPQVQPARTSHMLPPSQYDAKFPERMKLGNLLRNNWEIIPLFLVTMTSMGILFFSIFWAIGNKVDVVFTTHNRENLSRTMNLRNPVNHKIFRINQEYHPWLEMQDSLDKMRQMENKLRKMKDRSKRASVC